MRYTEYHAGKAVIKDKSLLPQAMKKLAKLEDIEDRQREKERIMNDDLISRKALLDEVKSFQCSYNRSQSRERSSRPCGR